VCVCAHETVCVWSRERRAIVQEQLLAEKRKEKVINISHRQRRVQTHTRAIMNFAFLKLVIRIKWAKQRQVLFYHGKKDALKMKKHTFMLNIISYSYFVGSLLLLHVFIISLYDSLAKNDVCMFHLHYHE